MYNTCSFITFKKEQIIFILCLLKSLNYCLKFFMNLDNFEEFDDLCRCHLLGEFFFRRRKKNFVDEKINFAGKKYFFTT